MNYLDSVFKYLVGSSEEGTRLFSVVHREVINGQWHKLKYRKIHLNIKKIKFTVKVIKHWYRLPREVVESPSLEVLHC